MTKEQELNARNWYSQHREHVNKMMGGSARVEPTGIDANHPETDFWVGG